MRDAVMIVEDSIHSASAGVRETRPLLLAGTLTAGLAWAVCAGAQEAPVSIAPNAPVTLEGLESAFWACDFAATMRGIDIQLISVCTAATEELKRVKFGGDFDQLVSWWQRNKAMEHGKLEAGHGLR